MARDGLTFEDLLFIARRVGVEVIAAPSSHRGQLGRMGTVVGLTRHHTGTLESFKPDEDYPTYQVVKEGRPGLENSLSAFGLGRHRAIYVFSEYLSWHAGEWLWDSITDGNGHFLGIEAEGTGQWTDWQKDIYPRLCASILLFIGEGIDMMPRHLDGAMPRGRKADAANLPADFTARVANYLAHPEQIPVNAESAVPTLETDMPLTLTTVDTKRIYVWDGYDIWNTGSTELAGAVGRVRNVEVNQRQVDVIASDVNRRKAAHLAAVAKAASGDPVDLQELAAGIAASLTPALVGALADKGGLSREDVEAAVREVFGDAAAA